MRVSKSMKYDPPENQKAIIIAWLRRARESQFSHYGAAKRLANCGWLFGVPVIFITAVLGASAFASILAQTVPLYAKLIAGLISLSAAVLSSLQTFFKFPERSEKHRIFGAKFGAVRRELEILHIQTEINPTELAAIRVKLDKLAEEAPDVDAALFMREKDEQAG